MEFQLMDSIDSHDISPTALRKLNLGCGTDHRPGYLNVDMNPGQRPDLVANVLELHMLPSKNFDEIIAQDVLEHFKWRDTPRALFEWNRLLMPGGKLFIRTTYVIGLGRRFADADCRTIEAQKTLLMFLFSNQWVEGDYHLTSFTERLIQYYLWETGFRIDEISLRDGWLLEVVATKTKDCFNLDMLSNDLTDIIFVGRLYKEILLRPGGDSEISGFVDRLLSGSFNRLQLIMQFLASEEREQAMMDACPDFRLEIDEQAPSLSNTGGSFASVANPLQDQDIVAAQIITGLYRTLLLREPDTGALESFIPALSRGEIDFGKLVGMILTSKEFCEKRDRVLRSLCAGHTLIG
jgi:hypothetical protein